MASRELPSALSGVSRIAAIGTIILKQAGYMGLRQLCS